MKTHQTKHQRTAVNAIFKALLTNQCESGGRLLSCLYIPKLLGFLFLWWVMPISVYAQFNFPEYPIEVPETDGAKDVFAVDLDGDGDADVLSASTGDDKIAWYENLGNGNFSTQNVISTNANGANSVYATDLDGDGDADVLSASQNDDKIAWYENLGNGNFSTQNVISTNADKASSVYATDLDGDGDADVLSASQNDDKIAWYENLGNGNFSTQNVISTNANGANSVYATDLDGDGDADVLSASQNDDKIAWYENLGNGNFSTQNVISTNADGANSVYATDLDGDGDTDVLSASQNDDKIAWYENLGNGNFSTQNTISTAGWNPYSVYATDLDGDGDADVISASHNRIAWYENLGEGDFSTQNVISTNANNASSVYATDLDGDGNADVLSASTGDDKIAWYENLGDGNFSTQNIITTTTAGASCVYAIDLDNDGDTDVLAGTSTGNKIAWYENLGEGNFSTQNVISTNVNGITSVYATDLDGDGDADVLSASQNDDKIAWYENLGGGNFSTQNVLTTNADYARSVYATDLDGDGDADVLSASFESDWESIGLAWYENLGDGSFSEPNTIGFGERDVYATDMDSDGDADILCASLSHISWYENLGNGNFSTQDIIWDYPHGAEYVYAIDLDGDGDADVLSISLLVLEFQGITTCLAWHENLGDGNFSTPNVIGTNNLAGIMSAYPTDLDEDGDVDVLTTSPHNGIVRWFENLGDGNFGLKGFMHLTGAQSVYATDLDGDADVDILSGGSDKIVWYKSPFNNAQINGTVFYDVNENGTLDNGESGLDFQQVNITSNNEITYNYANQYGYYAYYLDEQVAGNYALNFAPLSGWHLTTPDSYILDLEAGQSSSGNNFGLYPDSLYGWLSPYISTGINRCNWEVDFNITVVNEGTLTSDSVVVIFNADELTPYISAEPEPDFIDEEGVLYWNLGVLFPAQQENIALILQMPGVEAIGSILTYDVETQGFKNGQLISENTTQYSSELACAYDPNDKQVQPPGIGEANYTLMEEELLYQIRFQNTGNDTAFNVRVADQLSPHLDWTTFRPITNSHNMQTYLSETGLVEFVFNNILLPDSVVNEPESHGYILYAIKPLPDLSDNTLIENTAEIYFDFNPPIITNTTSNTMVYELPWDTPITLNMIAQVCEGEESTVLYYQVSGGLPAAEPSAFYTLTGDYQTEEMLFAQSIFTLNVPNGSLIELSVTDAVGNETTVTEGPFACAVLAVSLSDFTGTAQPSANRLEWTTLTETNHAYFDVLRLGEDGTFDRIGRVAGNGNSVSQNDYMFLDDHPPVPVAYYQLQSADEQGKVSNSGIVAVHRSEASGIHFSLQPNPANEVVYLNVQGGTLPAGETTYRLYNHLGQFLKGNTFSEGNTFPIDLSGLPPGVYLIRVNANGIEQYLKVLKKSNDF